MPGPGPDVEMEGPAAESTQAQREQGCIAGWEQRRGGEQKSRLWKGRGAGKKLVRGRSKSTAGERVPGVGNWD